MLSQHHAWLNEVAAHGHGLRPGNVSYRVVTWHDMATRLDNYTYKNATLQTRLHPSLH